MGSPGSVEEPVPLGVGPLERVTRVGWDTPGGGHGIQTHLAGGWRRSRLRGSRGPFLLCIFQVATRTTGPLAWSCPASSPGPMAAHTPFPSPTPLVGARESLTPRPRPQVAASPPPRPSGAAAPELSHRTCRAPRHRNYNSRAGSARMRRRVAGDGRCRRLRGKEAGACASGEGRFRHSVRGRAL